MTNSIGNILTDLETHCLHCNDCYLALLYVALAVSLLSFAAVLHSSIAFRRTTLLRHSRCTCAVLIITTPKCIFQYVFPVCYSDWEDIGV